MMKEKFALISVYNKNGLKNLCNVFLKNNILSDEQAYNIHTRIPNSVYRNFD